jgi:hypothetical protein
MLEQCLQSWRRAQRCKDNDSHVRELDTTCSGTRAAHVQRQRDSSGACSLALACYPAAACGLDSIPTCRSTDQLNCSMQSASACMCREKPSSRTLPCVTWCLAYSADSHEPAAGRARGRACAGGLASPSISRQPARQVIAPSDACHVHLT